MSNLASRSTFYSLLSKLYSIAHNLEDDRNYERVDAVNDLIEIIKWIEDDRDLFQKEGESNC
jgi:hypothetical protein